MEKPTENIKQPPLLKFGMTKQEIAEAKKKIKARDKFDPKNIH